jgi:hypothetical protein
MIRTDDLELVANIKKAIEKNDYLDLIMQHKSKSLKKISKGKGEGYGKSK